MIDANAQRERAAVAALDSTRFLQRAVSEPVFLKRQNSTTSVCSAPEEGLPLTSLSRDRTLLPEEPTNPNASAWDPMNIQSSLMSDEAARVGPGGDLVAAVAATNTAERSDVGNIGVFLCNWGKTAKNKDVHG